MFATAWIAPIIAATIMPRSLAISLNLFQNSSSRLDTRFVSRNDD
jgi:hypothetical protein